MHNQYIALHFLLWITTLAFISVFDYLAGKIAGKKSQEFANLRLPKFISLAVSSVTAITAIYLLNKACLSFEMANYLAVPYFAANAYFIVVFFRETKKANICKIANCSDGRSDKERREINV